MRCSTPYSDKTIKLAIILSRSINRVFDGPKTYTEIKEVLTGQLSYEVTAENFDHVARCALDYYLITVDDGDGPENWWLDNNVNRGRDFTVDQAKAHRESMLEQEALAREAAEAEAARAAEVAAEDARLAEAAAQQSPTTEYLLDQLHTGMKASFSGRPQTRAELSAWIDGRGGDDAQALRNAKEEVLDRMAQSDQFKRSGCNCCCFFATRYAAVDPDEEASLLARAGHGVN